MSNTCSFFDFGILGNRMFRGLIGAEIGGKFWDQLRDLVAIHMEPDKESVFLFMGVVGSDIRRHSIKSGLIKDIDYVFSKDHPDISKYGFDVLTSTEAAYSTLGVYAKSCSIPFDTPVDEEHEDDWREYSECVVALVKECRTAFSHVDSERNWITNCMDPRGQFEEDELDLNQDLSELSSTHLDNSNHSNPSSGRST